MGLFKESLFENKDVCVDFLNEIVRKFKPGVWEGRDNHLHGHFEMYASGEYLCMIIDDSITAREFLSKFILDIESYIKEELVAVGGDRSEIGFYTLIEAYAERFPGFGILWSERNECFKCSSDFDLLEDCPSYFD